MRASAPTRPRGRLQHRNRVLRVAGERQRQAGIRRVDETLRFSEQQLASLILAQRDLNQRELQHDLRLGAA